MQKYQDLRIFQIGPLALLLMNAGCVSTALQLPSNHPARPEAPSGRVESEPAAILRPEAPLYPSDALAAPAEMGNRQLEQVSASNADDPAPAGTREAPYVGRGVIQSIGEGQLVIQHETIPGFMGAMTMGFSIAEEATNSSKDACRS